MDDKLAVALTQGVLSIAGTVIGIYLNNKVKLKDPDKVKEYLKNKEKVLEQLEDLRSRTHASRSSLWLFSNGTKFYTGEHLQRLSCYAEANISGADSVMEEFQEVNIGFFERTLFQMNSQDIIYSDESQYSDALATINKKYNINYVVCAKIKTKNKWTGVLVLGFETEPKDINIVKALIELSMSKINNQNYVK